MRLVPIEDEVSENEEDNNSVTDESVIEESSEPLRTAQLIDTRSETLSAAILEAPEDKSRKFTFALEGNGLKYSQSTFNCQEDS